VSAQARRRLAPALLALLEQGSGTPGAAACTDGWVAVEIELGDASSDIVRGLETAGAMIERVDGARVRATVALDRLGALAEAHGVRWIAAHA
jgi:hypothetical protein